jgi:anti-anti-sigma factor
MTTPAQPDDFTIERTGEVTIITASSALETIDPTVVEQAAELMLQPLRHLEVPLVVVDLSRVDFFGSSFLSLLLRCWKLANAKGGQMVLSGVSTRARELLHITSLDMVWPIYESRREAVEALLAD